MPTGLDLVKAILAMHARYQPTYDNSSERRCHPDEWPHVEDCSGVLCWGQNAVVGPFPCTNTWAMATLGHQQNLTIPVEEAFDIPGMWLFQGANEGQTNINNEGHGGITIGDGAHTYEARGHYAGTGIYLRDSQDWDYAMVPPGVQKVPAPGPAPTVEVTKRRVPVSMVRLPPSSTTNVGRVPSVRADFEHNGAVCEDGARLKGDQEPTWTDDHRVRIWRPAKEDRKPGMTIIEVGDLRHDDGDGCPAEADTLFSRWALPNGTTATYKMYVDR